MFSVIIPTHNRPNLLRRALTSLTAQTWRDFTVIIVSDTPAFELPGAELAALPGPYRVVVRNGQPGPGASRNVALDLVATDYVIFLDDDDTFAPTHLEVMAQGLKGMVGRIGFCSFAVVVEDRATEPPTFVSRNTVPIGAASVETTYVKNAIPNSCLAFPRAVASKVRFDNDLVLYEDWAYLLDALRYAPLGYIETDTVNIHKSYAEGAHNLRRGRANDDKLVAVTLEIYRRFPAVLPQLREDRQRFFERAGLQLPIEYF